MSQTVREERDRISRISGITGIVVNVFLCTMKLIIGKTVNSISILSDGFNNLTDVFNALIVFLGYRFTEKPADREHPYGHGRFEYMMSQFISVMVMYVGISLLRTSISRLKDPMDALMNRYAIIVLCVSLAVKFGLGLWYDRMYRKSSLSPLKAQKADSLGDAAGTAVILVGYLLDEATALPVDAIFGIIVSLVIVLGGVRLFLQMTSILLGQPADEKLYEKIEEILKDSKEISGHHDLRLHAYGPGNVYGSCDVEVDGERTLFETHDFLDVIEKRILEETGVQITLHPDPIGKSRKLREYRKSINDVLKGYDERISYHDLQYNMKSDSYSLDVVIPYDLKVDEEEVCGKIREIFREDEVEIKVDRE